ncbi:aminomethyltransferase family protein [Lutibaculum baratangense]|uniref:Aminomethyltransferase n=1 Tax=Lutibaculum baratangense AMV1 TaxID=631454 RepID=V4TEA1_9HYPH|nr:aminomethyltransferase family protein [Lutibaculum baratangense]ESR24538.1 Aminomethyltransferase [Lutibaculum baratangense AMV1]
MNEMIRDTSTAAGSRKGVERGLKTTPFDARLKALDLTRDWMWWAGCASPAVLDTVESEYFAIRNQATLYDISPIYKYRISGPEAERVVNRLVTRDIRKLKPGRVAYAIWCDEDGMVIDDGTIFRFGESDFRLCCQEPQYSWLLDIAWGFDVEMSDETEDVAALALQGPTSFSVLEAAGLGDARSMRPFDLREVEPGLWISRTGFTGDLGYELWISPGAALPLWDRLWEAGRLWGLRAIGYRAMDIARIEAGFVMTGADFISSHRATRTGRTRSAFELGFGRLVDFGKGHFNGRRALLKLSEREPRHMLVGLDIAGKAPARDALVYHRGRKEIGRITSAAWSPTAKRNIALAELAAPFGVTRSDRIFVEIYVNKEGRWDRVMAPARIVERPFYRPARVRATPPKPF